MYKSQATIFIAIGCLMLYMFFGLVKQMQSIEVKAGLHQSSEILTKPLR